MDDRLNEKMERCYNDTRRSVYKKISKPVIWNGQVFESGAALSRHLKLPYTGSICSYIKKKRKLKGHVPEYFKGDTHGKKENEKKDTMQNWW